MIEKHIIITQSDPQILYGPGDNNLRHLRALHPQLHIHARDTDVRIIGPQTAVDTFARLLQALDHHCAKTGRLTPTDIIHHLHTAESPETGTDSPTDVIVHTADGHPITPRTPGQRRLVEAFTHHDLTIAIGPAGTGKTYTAIALALRALKHREVKRLILCRPAVEAGEKLGYLPGDMKEKVDPYLQPLYDALQDMLTPQRLAEYIATNTIQIAPLAYMRGRTLSHAIVILDEAQNTTTPQLKMFLTRMGHGTKMIVTGDCTQIDLPPTQPSGLREATHILADIPRIAIIQLDETDIVRHQLVTDIVAAYARHHTPDRHTPHHR